MNESGPLFDQVNLVVADMDAMLRCYRNLGVTIASPQEWPTGSGALHAQVEFAGVRLEFDNISMAKIWDAARRGGRGGKTILSFSLPSREAVDARYQQVTAQGYAGLHPPHDAFWGAQYAIVQDPEGNDVGLMSPIDPNRKFSPKVE